MQSQLNARFRRPLEEYYERRIIVWRDEEGSFADQVEELSLDNARVLVMRENTMFTLRRQIEVEFARENILLYCPMRFEKAEDNWLQDVFLYSEEFRADYWSMLFDELNIENTRENRDFARSVAPFFKSRERRNRLMALKKGYPDARALRDGVLCAACGVRTGGLAEAVRAVLSVPDGEENEPLAAIEKYCGKDAFWDAMREAYGYEGARETTRLCLHLLVSAALIGADEQRFAGVEGSAEHATQAYGLFIDWQRADRESLMEACLRAEERGRVEEKLSEAGRDELMRMSVFPAVDTLLLRESLSRFADGRLDTDDSERLLRERRDKPWHDEYAPYYDAVRALTDMTLFYRAYRGGFGCEDAPEMWREYARGLYRMDAFDRAFGRAFEAALDRGIIALEDALCAAAEAEGRLYKNWYFAGLSERWEALLGGRRPEEALPVEPRQERFYANNLAAAQARTFVIVSDGMRYEIGCELARRLNGRLPGNAECEPLLCALPTVTPVGMAALLPHRKLYLQDDLRVLCDELPTESGRRQKALEAACPQSAAIGLSEFRLMSRAQRQERVKGMKVVYLYQDVIDAAGESGGNPFQACESAMNELVQTARILTGELSAAQILFTADHGFVYTRAPLEECDKSSQGTLTGEVLECKRRYAVVRERQEGAICLPLKTLGREDLYGAFPRGGRRFALQGGTNYVHGGLSLQEMMAPLVRYVNRKEGQKGYKAITKATIALLGENRKISNGIFTLNFYQKERCLGKVQPRMAVARFEDEQGHIISDEHRLCANSAAIENNDRVMRVTFQLLGGGYDRTAEYDLVVRDAEDGEELVRAPFKIDIVFGLDFDL